MDDEHLTYAQTERFINVRLATLYSMVSRHESRTCDWAAASFAFRGELWSAGSRTGPSAPPPPVRASPDTREARPPTKENAPPATHTRTKETHEP